MENVPSKNQDQVHAAPGEDVWLNSVCNMCFNACGIKVHRVDGTIVKIEGDPNNPQNMGKLCAKGNSAIMSLYDPYRTLRPLKRTNPNKGIGVDPKWMEIGWEEAIQTVADRLKEVRQKEPRGLMAMSFDLGYRTFPVMPALMAAFGTPHWFTGGAAFFCGNVNHQVSYLVHAAIEMDPDLDYCNYCLMFGNQTGFISNRDAVSQSKKMADARMRGMKLVVVDPVCTNGAAKADEWLPIRPGADGVLALAMLDVLLNELGIYDREFLKAYTNGPYLIKPDGHYLRDKETNKPLVWDMADNSVKVYDAADLKDPAIEGNFTVEGLEVKPSFQLLKEHVRQYNAEKAAELTTIPAATIRRIAKEFGEAARIGSKIAIEGNELPYRPAAADFGKGALAHKNGMATGIAIELLNVVVGAIDVPGGILGSGAAGPTHETYHGQRWHVKEGTDGLVVSTRAHWPTFPRPVKEPQTLQAFELFPIAPYSTTILPLNLINPDMFKVPYGPEVLIQFRANMMMSSAEPETIAEFLRKIPFIVSFAREIDETTEFADIVFPEAHEMERLDPFPNHPIRQLTGTEPWYWEVRQPVSEAPNGVGHWVSVILEIVDRIGIGPDVNVLMNSTFNLKPEYALEPNKRYSMQEIADRQSKSMLGDEYDVDWFKENGCLKLPKTIEEAYIRSFVKGRIPLYLEYLLDTGLAVKQITDKLNLHLDTSGYQPLPTWDTCPTFKEKSSEYSLYAVNYKLPYHTFAQTVENPWLDDLCQHHPYAYRIVIGTQAAAKKGIKTGDEIWVETSTGRKVKGIARVSECIHPEVVGIAGTLGHWAKSLPIAEGKGAHFNSLLPLNLDRIDPVSTALDACIRVRVYK